MGLRPEVRGPHLDDLPGLHGQRGEVSAAVDRDALAQDGVQTPHLVPTQHADTPAVVRGVSGGHDDRNRLDTRPQRRSAGGANTTSGANAQAAERDGPLLGQSWRKLLQDGGLVRDIRHVRAEACSRTPVPSSVTLDPARSRRWTTPAFYPTGINRSLLIGWTLTRPTTLTFHAR